MKILDFFLFLWVIFALLDPDQDPATQILRIHADPDPKPWMKSTVPLVSLCSTCQREKV
jgi:hypothetical protein